MPLQPLDIVNGIFGLLFVSISIILGITIILKYFKLKDINYVYVGLSWILFVSGWYGTTASFLVALFTGGEGLSFEMIMLLNFVPLPLALIFWMMAYTNFLYKDRQKMIMVICCIFVFGFLVIFLYYIITDPIIIGEKISPVDTKANSIMFGIILVLYIIALFFTGIKFAIETMKFENKETKLKGKLLLIAFPSFCIGAFLDATMPTIALTLIIFRLILISSAIEFYAAFILPKWIKALLLK